MKLFFKNKKQNLSHDKNTPACHAFYLYRLTVSTAFIFQGIKCSQFLTEDKGHFVTSTIVTFYCADYTTV